MNADQLEKVRSLRELVRKVPVQIILDEMIRACEISVEEAAGLDVDLPTILRVRMALKLARECCPDFDERSW